MKTAVSSQSGRNPVVDIAKGLLIILVVVGHTSGLDHDVSRYILWFHMPCFFIISGLFMNCAANCGRSCFVWLCLTHASPSSSAASCTADR